MPGLHQAFMMEHEYRREQREAQCILRSPSEAFPAISSEGTYSSVTKGQPEEALTVGLSQRIVLSLLLCKQSVSVAWTETVWWFHRTGTW